jgi:hypothetical protein
MQLYIGTIYRVNRVEASYTGLTYPLYHFRDRDGNQLEVTAEDLVLETVPDETTETVIPEAKAKAPTKRKEYKISE